LSDTGAAESANDETADNSPHQVNADPAQAVGSDLVPADQAEPEHHEREGGSVVEPGFAGEAEPNRLGVVLVRDLHIGGKHGIGRRENCAEQHGHAKRETRDEHPERRDGGDGDHHRQRGEQHRRAPAPVPERQPQLQPRGEERDDDRDLGQHLDGFRVSQHVDIQQSHAPRPEHPPDCEVEHRTGQRQALQHRAGQRHGNQQDADDEEPHGEH
jgi:hypothetical protein